MSQIMTDNDSYILTDEIVMISTMIWVFSTVGMSTGERLLHEINFFPHWVFFTS